MDALAFSEQLSLSGLTPWTSSDLRSDPRSPTKCPRVKSRRPTDKSQVPTSGRTLWAVWARAGRAAEGSGLGCRPRHTGQIRRHRAVGQTPATLVVSRCMP